MRIVISGATGLIGTALAASLERDGIEVTRLVRRPATAPGQVRWDPAGPLDPGVVSGSDAVVSLAGAPVAGGRWTPARKRLLRDSRIISTGTLVAAIRAAAAPPPVLLAGSAIGFYGAPGDREVTEADPAGGGFLAGLVTDWEAAAAPAAEAGTRVVTLRSGIVLSGSGGMLGPLAPLFRLGLGARLGSGRQYLSWIALPDHVGAMRFLLGLPAEPGAAAPEADRPASGSPAGGGTALSGPVNLTAPAPVTNAEFTAALGRALHRPALLQVPSPLLRGVLGELSAELLGSSRVRPARLLDAGFTYRYPGIDAALAAAVR